MAAELIALSCGHCGAPLSIPGDARFVTCTHCNSRLEVQNTGSAAYTRVLEQVAERTEALAEQVETLKQQHELERIDREWEMEREKYLIHGKHGRVYEPGEATATAQQVFVVFWCVIVGGMGLVFFLVFPPLALVPFGMIAFALWGMSNNQKKAAEFREASQAYQQRRRAFLERIEAAEAAPRSAPQAGPRA